MNACACSNQVKLEKLRIKESAVTIIQETRSLPAWRLMRSSNHNRQQQLCTAQLLLRVRLTPSLPVVAINDSNIQICKDLHPPSSTLPEPRDCPRSTRISIKNKKNSYCVQLNKWQIGCSTNCYYSKNCKRKWSQAKDPLRGPLSLVTAH